MTGRPMEVLLVEDNPADVFLMREVLGESDLDVNITDVSDGTEAMSYLRRDPPYAGAVRPDVILLDLNLPRKDGREVLRELRANGQLKAIPVVVLTTSEMDDDTVSSYELGASCYIIKPAELKEYDRVVEALEGFRSSRGKDT